MKPSPSSAVRRPLSAVLSLSLLSLSLPAVAAVESGETLRAAQIVAERTATEVAEKAVTDAVKAAAEKAAKETVEAAVKAAVEKAAKDAAAATTAKTDAKADAEQAKTERKEAMRQIETRVFRLEHAAAAEVAENLNKMWSGDFGEAWKVTKMAVAFPESNAVLVTAPRMILDACEKAVAALDVESQQVYIEARFVELGNTASHKLGIDWSMLDGMKGTLGVSADYNERRMQGVSEYNSEKDTYTLSSDTAKRVQDANLSHVNVTLGMSDLYLVLRALESTEDARTFSNPKIIVASGKTAKVDMTEKYPNVAISAKRTTSGSGSDSLDLSMNMAAIPGEDKFMFAKEAFFSWGIELEVTPRISTNGLISVSIVPTISSQTDWVSAGTADTNTKTENNAGTISSKYPVINVQRLITEFSMSSGTTAVIGGLSRTVEKQVDNGIPLLRDLWWVGPRLFGSKQRIKEQKEIIVFVTVGLVDPRSVAKDAGLPKNAVLGRQYTEDIRLEPGDRRRHVEGIQSLDLRPLEEQYNDPRRTNRVQRTLMNGYVPIPFTQGGIDE